jgi:hypothetical protein
MGIYQPEQVRHEQRRYEHAELFRALSLGTECQLSPGSGRAIQVILFGLAVIATVAIGIMVSA